MLFTHPPQVWSEGSRSWDPRLTIFVEKLPRKGLTRLKKACTVWASSGAPIMITSVTTSTVSTVSSAASIAAFGVLATLVLISLLVVKELASSDDHPWLQRLSNVLNVAIAPLLMAFVAIVGAKVAEVL